MAADLADLYAQLDSEFSDGAHADALKLADQILEAEPRSELALRCRCACLMQLSRTDEALELLDAEAQLLGGTAALPRAYCLYQKGAVEDALGVVARALDGSDGGSAARDEADTAGLLHLRAQLHYKRSEYTQSAASYRQVLEGDPGAASDPEVLTNATAALVMGGEHAEAMALFGAHGGANGCYELAYNGACAQLGIGELGPAAELLEEALELSTRALQAEDGADAVDDDELEAEQAAIKTQRAFVSQRAGEDAAAAEAYTAVLRVKGHESIDNTVAAVAANNLVALRGDRDLFDSAKRLRAALADAVAAKLSSAQKHAAMHNQALLAWHMSKPQACREYIDALEAAFPESDVPVLLRATLLCRPKAASREAPSAEAERLLSAFVSAQPARAARVVLALAQMQARAPAGGAAKGGGGAAAAAGALAPDSLRRACATLASAPPPLRLAPRIVATATGVYESLGDIGAATAFLDETLAQLGAAAAGSGLPREHLVLLHGASAFFERHREWRRMADVEGRLLAAEPRSLEARARLIVAASHYDVDLAAEHDAALPDVAGEDEEDEEMVDIEQLESVQLPAAGAGAGRGGGKRPQSELEGGADGAAARGAAEGGAAAAAASAAKRRKCARAPPRRRVRAPRRTRTRARQRAAPL